MKILNIRWGYDGGGVCCGLVEGSCVVEILVRLNNGQTRFVTVSRYEEAEKAIVTELSVFDVLMAMMSVYADFEAEYGKVTAAAIETYDYEIYELPEELLKSEFLPIVRLARVALNDVEFETIESGKGADEFIAPFLETEVSELEIPSDDIPRDDEDDFYDDDGEVNISMLPEHVQRHLRECEGEESTEKFTFYYSCTLGDRSDDGEYETSVTEEELYALRSARRAVNVEKNDGHYWTVDLSMVEGCGDLYHRVSDVIWQMIDDNLAAEEDSELGISI